MSGEIKKKRILVIGAGVSGLAAIKCCLDEKLDVVCCETTEDIGGLWRYKSQVVDGQASVMRSTIINTCKEMSAYSDFPPPDDFPNFMHHSKMLEYLRLYANHFGLLHHILFKHQVVSVTKSEDFSRTGQWRAKIRDLRFIKGDVEEDILVDGVMICTGHHAIPRKVTFPGIDSFKGKVIHSHGYRSSEGFDGKNVLVIGFGNSGVDVASELSFIAKQVYLSTRKGSWILPRIGLYGDPTDCVLVTRLMQWLQYLLPYNFNCSIVEAGANFTFHHGVHYNRPSHRILSQHVTFSENLATRLNTGTILLKNNVRRFTSDGVIFEGDPSEYEIDVVVMATGYSAGKPPFLEDGVVSVNKDTYDLYKLMLSPSLEKQTLIFIGLAQPLGSIMPISEMQSRWFLRSLTNQLTLPNESNMWKSIRQRSKRNRERFYQSPRHELEIFFVEYMDDLAKDIGCYPDLRKMFFSDRKLFWICVVGPGCLPYQYRLQGPHACPEESKKRLLTVRHRMKQPLRTRTTGRARINKGWLHHLADILSSATVFIFIFFFSWLWFRRSKNTRIRSTNGQGG